MSSSSSLLSLARRTCLSPSSSTVTSRTFATTSAAQARAPRRTKTVMEENMTEEDMFALLTEPSSIEDSPSAGHRLLMQRRMMLRYLRVIEHEMPKLVAYRKPFVPPSSASTPLYVKHAYYFGELHPAEAKRSLVVAVDDLPLTSPSAVHKLKLLAGPRWTPNPPADAGVNNEEAWGNGYVKISSDTFASAAMNLKWVSDALGRLVESANDATETFEDLPLDMRHVYAKVRKGKKGDHLRNRPLHRVSVRDFPKEWLPRATPVGSAGAKEGSGSSPSANVNAAGTQA